MEYVKVLNKGQIVIPTSIRKKYAIKPGNKIQMFEYGRLIYIIPMPMILSYSDPYNL